MVPRLAVIVEGREGVVVVIALFTDFGTRDAYVAQLKGAILSIHPTAQLLDLTHEVAPLMCAPQRICSTPRRATFRRVPSAWRWLILELGQRDVRYYLQHKQRNTT